MNIVLKYVAVALITTAALGIWLAGVSLVVKSVTDHYQSTLQVN